MKIVADPEQETVPLPGAVSIAIREFNLPRFSHPWHQHPEVELTWILEGSGLRYVGDSVEPFEPGDFCLLGSRLPHAWLTQKQPAGRRARSLVVQFDPAHFGEDFWQLPEFCRIGRLLDRAAYGLRFDRTLGTQLREKLLARSHALSRFTAVLEMMDELAQQNARSLSLAPWTRNRRLDSDPRLQRVLSHLASHLGETITQAKVARLAGHSPAAFSRFFRRTMGRTFQTYLCDLRLSITCRQLLETDRNVSEIAYAAGFGNLSTFNRVFRQRRGLSPRDFRRQSSRVA